MEDIIFRLIGIIITFAVIYFLGVFIAWDTNPLNWWIFTSTFGRFIAVFLFIIVLVANLKED